MCCALVQASDSLKSMQTWELEDYNDWNLPFAKTVEIAGRYSGNKTIAEYKETDGDFPHLLGANSYKMEVDPSALFTVLFLQNDVFTNYTTDQLVQLDYAFLGDET